MYQNRNLPSASGSHGRSLYLGVYEYKQFLKDTCLAFTLNNSEPCTGQPYNTPKEQLPLTPPILVNSHDGLWVLQHAGLWSKRSHRARPMERAGPPVEHSGDWCQSRRGQEAKQTWPVSLQETPMTAAHRPQRSHGRPSRSCPGLGCCPGAHYYPSPLWQQ